MDWPGACASAAFWLAATAALYLASAETVYRHDTAASVRLAARMDTLAPPAHYFERLADLDAPNAAAALDAALDADPRRTEARLTRGLAAEQQGRRTDGERDMLEAARRDRQYLPTWTLANFYFRAGDGPNFWTWARRAALLTEDARPLLQLANAWDAHPGAAHAENVLSGLGGGEALERRELDDLLAQHDMDGAQLVARMLAARHSPANRLRIETAVDREIKAGRDRDAVELWSLVEPPDGRIVTNGGFSHVPDGIGFDWRMPPAPGISAQWNPSRLTFSLTGVQPQVCALVEQTVPLPPSRIRLRFEYSTKGFEYSTKGMEGYSDIRWSLNADEGPALDPSPTRRPGLAEFHRTKNTLGRLALLYRREPGNVRSRGSIEIWNVRAESF